MVEGVAGETPAPKKPALLRGGMVLAWIYAVLLVVMLVMQPMLSAMGTAGNLKSPFADSALQAQLVGQMKTTSQLFIIPLLVLSIFTAYGLAKDRYWSRMMMMTMLILGVVLTPPEMATPAIYGVSGGLAVFGWWYLYRKANVVGYYAALKAKQLQQNRTRAVSS